MRTILILAIAAVAIASAGAADPIHDGAWWIQQPLEFKRAYVWGALDHAAPSMAPADGLRAEWIGPDVGEVVDRLDSFYALKENRGMMVQEALPLMLAWLAAGPHATLQEGISNFYQKP